MTKTFLVGEWVSRGELPELLEFARRIYGENETMPMQQQKSSLMAKYGSKLDTAVQKHGADETTYGRIQLPGGISNGVAKLVTCKFETYKEGSNMKTASGASAVGDYYFTARGVVVQPSHVMTKDGSVKVAGLHTSIMEPVCDTKTQAGKVTTQEEHVANILNVMRTLAGEEFTRGATGNDLEGLAAALEGAGPFFKFSTSQSAPTPQYPDPKVWENWQGSKGLDDYAPPEEEGAVQDDTGGENLPEEPPPFTPVKPVNRLPAKPAAPTARANGQPPANSAPARKTPTVPKPKAKEPEPEPEQEFSEQGDLDSLVELAEGDDEDAKTRLTEMALEAGVSEEVVRIASDWAAIRDLILGVGGDADAIQGEEEPAGEPEPEEPWAPKVKQIYLYQPVDKMGKPTLDAKKKPMKPVEVAVDAVDSSKQTVKAHSLDNPKLVYPAIRWDKLIQDQ